MYDTTGLPKTVRKNLMWVLICILFGNFSFSVTSGTALTGYVKALGATDFAYSLLVGAPYVVKVMQLVTSYVLEKTRARRTLLIWFGLIGRLMWIPVALVPYFIPTNEGMVQIWAILVLVMVLSCICAFNETAFNSLMADMVPKHISGRYFGARQCITMAGGIVAGLLVSWLLDTFTAGGSLTGYTIVFVMAGIFGALDVACYFFVEFPPMGAPKVEEKRENLLVMVREVMSNTRYRKVIVLLTIWSFVSSLSSPFYSVHMLGPMQMSYTEINLLSSIMINIATLLFSGMWGKCIDRYGNKPVLQLSTLMLAMVPLLWLFTGPRRIWMVPVAEFYSGIIWAAVTLAQQNTYLYQAPEKNRSMYFAVYFCLSQMIGVSLSYAVGGWMVDHLYLPLSQTLKLTLLGFEMNQYHYIFFTSSMLRIVVSLFLLNHLPEQENDVKPMQMFKDIAYRLTHKHANG